MIEVIQKHNLPDLFNAVFNLYVTRVLSHGACNLLFSLLYKFNQVLNKFTKQYFPDTLNIYNFELAKLLGINEKTLIKLRHELTTYRIIQGNDESWIIKYESGGTREGGFYSINYHLLETLDDSNLSLYYSLNREQTENNIVPISQDIGNNIDAIIPENLNKEENGAPEFPKNEKSGQNLQPFTTQLNETKQNSLSSEVILKDVHGNNGNGKLQKTLKLIQTKYNQFTIDSKPIKDALIKISEYPEEQQAKALEKGSLVTKQNKIVSYMLNGLEKGWYQERTFGRATPDEWQPPEIVEENLDPEYAKKMLEIVSQAGDGIDVSEQLKQLRELYNGSK
jgi:hypothetical protein